ncbi:MAG: radical SAM protein, partial [Gammaproteobacteria bacterium]
KTVLSETDIPRLRLGSLEPWELPADFFELFDNPRLMPHLHLPLQSGSDSVLKRMARRCKTEEFAAIAERLRAQIPYFNVTTDIIVGFPGETEQEWQDSLDFVRGIGFGHIHIFSYSRREGTKASTLPGQIASEVKKQRSRQLHRLAETMKQEFFEANLGRRLPVLWESRTETSGQSLAMIFGYTPNYIRVARQTGAPEILENTIAAVTLRAVTDDYLLAE